MNNQWNVRELPRTVLAVLFIAIAIIASLWILQPFLPALIWSTLVVVSTEFGRTTGELTPGKGRDHHRFAFSGLLAGAGVKGGKAIGSTDEKGERVVDGGWAARRSIYPEDLAATVYSAMGIDWTKRITTTPSGRAFEYVEPQSGTSFLQPSEIAELWI